MSLYAGTAAPPAKTSLVSGITRLPSQVENLTAELILWLQTNSTGLVVGVCLALVIYISLVLVRGWLQRRLRKKTSFASWGWVLLRTVSGTRSFFLVMLAARISMETMGAAGQWYRLVLILFTVSAAVQAAIWTQTFILSLLERRTMPAADPDGTITSAFGVLRILIIALVWTLAGIILLDNLGVNVTALIAGLGVGGIAIGLAAQGIFSDLFAALSILFDRPFRRGDTIQVGGGNGVAGTVEHIGLKTTRIRAASGEIVILSNTQLLSQQINNLAHFTHRRVVMLLSVIQQTPVHLLAELPTELRKIVETRPRCEFGHAYFVNFSPSSLDFELAFLVHQVTFDAMAEERHAVGLAILQRFAELEIDFAYPSQTSFIAGKDGRILEPVSDTPIRPPGLEAPLR